MTKEEIIKLASETAINVYIKKYEQQRRNQAKHAIENTKRLLREYQNLKTHCEEAIFSAEDSVPTSLGLILTEIFDSNGFIKFQALMASKKRTELMLEHIDAMLTIYRARCESQKKINYDILKYCLIDGLDMLDVVDGLMIPVSERTGYRALNQGLKDMSVLLFGVYSLGA